MSEMRVGHGYDLHRLQAGGELRLGGVHVALDVSPVAHSDGDVVLHALVDAIMGATGLGDIGERFVNSDPRWKGARSDIFVNDVWGQVMKDGWKAGNVDVTILAERPKLKAYKGPIRKHIAGLLGCDQSRVNIKAGTNEGCDAIGRGEAIAAHVVVLLVKA